MAILRCNKCAHLQEQADSDVGVMVPCPRCGNPTQVYPTIFFVTRLLEKYFTAQREVIRLNAAVAGGSEAASAAPAAATPAATVDLSNTDRLTSSEQHQPIADWFRRRQISVQIAAQAVDTSGFFDEVATLIGRDLLLKEVLDRIRWAQQKGYASTVIPFDGRSPSDAQKLTSFCRQLYDYSFVAKAIPNKQKNHLLLVVQTAPAIRHFFNGEWLEWFALMTCVEQATARGKRFACARNLGLRFSDGEQQEVDVVLLLDGQLPILIECKSGEYRQDIDKCVGLRKRLGLGGQHLVVCVAGLEDEMARGLTAMYDLSFVSERGLVQFIERIV